LLAHVWPVYAERFRTHIRRVNLGVIRLVLTMASYVAT
jgi:hypothetical protein